jgi:hypothetical protein
MRFAPFSCVIAVWFVEWLLDSSCRQNLHYGRVPTGLGFTERCVATIIRCRVSNYTKRQQQLHDMFVAPVHGNANRSAASDVRLLQNCLAICQ